MATNARLLSTQSVWLSVVCVLSSCPAQAQFMTQPACAVSLDPAAPGVRTLAATCGSATFTVDAAMRRSGELKVATSANVYVRKIVLRYGSQTGVQSETIEIQFHRLVIAGEATEPLATARRGLSLQTVTIDVSPPGYGTDTVSLALVARDVASDVAVVTPVATAQPPSGDWILIGSTSAHLAQLRDTMPIGRGKGRFDGLIIATRGNDLPVQSVLVSPVNSPPFAVDMRAILEPGQQSGVIAIDPPDFLHEITVTYGTPPLQARVPTVEVRGRYAENWLGRVGENRQHAGGWILLGAVDVVVRPHGGQRSNYRIAGQQGQFKKLRFVARRGAVDLAGVTVEAGDGRQETLPTNTLLMPDAQSLPFAFTSGALPIASVSLSPRLHATSRIDASVEVWAQY